MTANLVMRETELGYFALPRLAGGGSTPALPGVVVLHDVWGLSEHYRDLARRFAGEGYPALAVSLYRDDEVRIEDPGRWMRELSDPDVLARIGSAVDALAADVSPGGAGVAVVGFCMGGTYALLAGCDLPGVAAVVPFYGLLSHAHGLLHSDEGLDPERKPHAPLDRAEALACPMLAFFGADDPYVPVSDVEELRERVAASGHLAEVVVYDDAGHAFMNDTRPDAYRPGAAGDAWRRTVEFLASIAKV